MEKNQFFAVNKKEGDLSIFEWSTMGLLEGVIHQKELNVGVKSHR